MYGIGVLFDIDKLQRGQYGMAAYRVFFEAVDTRLLANCTLADGDTNATLAGMANQYCIAVRSLDRSAIRTVKERLSRCNADGLAAADRRFLEGSALSREPLVDAVYIDPEGQLVDVDGNGAWVVNVWKAVHGKDGE